MKNEALDQRLLDSNLKALEEGAQLIKLLKNDEYTKAYKPAFQSTIGAHFRHVLEHYRCFFVQITKSNFCYDLRARDQSLECDPQYALETINGLSNDIRGLESRELGENFTIDDAQTLAPISTTINRELLFLQSHAAHHYAIIGAMTRAFGNKPDENFGVAIATRLHNDRCETSDEGAVSHLDNDKIRSIKQA